MESGEIDKTAMDTPDDLQLLNSSLFPLFPLDDDSHQYKPRTTEWLSNPSFTTELSLIDDINSSQPAYSSTVAELVEEEHDADEKENNGNELSESKHCFSYKLLESSSSDREYESTALEFRNRKKERKRKKRKLVHSRNDPISSNKDYQFSSRKSNVESWKNSESKPTKEYYFDSRGDQDNLEFGCLYKMDVARYKHYSLSHSNLGHNKNFYFKCKNSSVLDRDADMDGLDTKLVTGGRYCSPKYAALERHKTMKRLRIVAPKKSMVVMPVGDFIPLSEPGLSIDDVHGELINGGRSFIEESWEDEVLRKTKEFNKMSRERPHDENVWLSFAEFQDKVSSMQSMKGAPLQTLEKKISILEKATELNPDSEELWLSLFKCYENRDGADDLFSKWEKVLIQHPGCFRLWNEFLHVFKTQFSRFKVSEMRKIYSNAIQALSNACSRQKLQALDPEAVRLECWLVDLFVSLCRFEWQAGYQELATALFQAEIEYSLFCPSLVVTQQSKQRLFEYFWNSNGGRIGEDGALGWSIWLEKEEENRQRIIREVNSCEDDNGGWTGWSNPLSTSNKELDPENVAINDEDEAPEGVVKPEEDDAETLLKLLGIDSADPDAALDVHDASTWTRWSEEESSRDREQWMPLREKPDSSEADEQQLMRVVLFEDVSDYLFSLNSEEARFSLVSQFIDFFGGRITGFCSNSFSWNEKVMSSEVIPDCILEELRRLHDALIDNKEEDGGNSPSDFLLGIISEGNKPTMSKFLRNAALLCLTIFPRNHILQEAALIAEEAYNTAISDSSSISRCPCRALAKNLLKNDRHDALLCGVYAKREAAFGNIDLARKIFDMALLSSSPLPPILCFWYAEVELAAGSAESRLRALHILFSLGIDAYVPYRSQPSNLDILRARQGFVDRAKKCQSTWARGIDVDDHSVAFIISAALFEELTGGSTAAVDILSRAFSWALPEAQARSRGLESLFHYHIEMLRREGVDVRGPVARGLRVYPSSPNLLSALVGSARFRAPLRRVFDGYYRDGKRSVAVCLFAVLHELCRGDGVRGVFERAAVDEKLRGSVLMWRCFIRYENDVARDGGAARRVFFRAVHACPWSKTLWMDGYLKLGSVLTARELSDVQEVMRDKELNLRTDVYEILLQDEIN